MKKYKKEEITRTHTADILIGMYCDVCKKEITNGKVYYSVATHHHDWGNDSIDSYECHDICSYNCLAQHMSEYFSKAQGSEEYEISRERYYET